jgi:hypothetical protein
MDLRKQYKRLFEGRVSSNDSQLLTEAALRGFLNESNVDPKYEAQQIIEYWEDDGFSASYLKQDNYLNKAIKNYEIGMGVKIHRDTKKEIKKLVK